MKKDLIIVGASGFGREVAWLVERINKQKDTWHLLGFIDDNPDLQNKTVNDYPVLGSVADILKFPTASFVVAIGAAAVREKIVHKMLELCPQISFATLIDPTVEMSDLVQIGKGSILCAHTIFTVNITVGNHVIINLDCTVGHDAVLCDYVTVYPGVNISGNTKIGYAAELGTGMQIIQGKTVGDRSIIGAGAVVVRDVPEKCTAVGSPAKPIKFFE